MGILDEVLRKLFLLWKKMEDFMIVKAFLEQNNVRFYITSCLRQELVSYNKTQTDDNKVSMSFFDSFITMSCCHPGVRFDNDCVFKLVGRFNSSKLIVITTSDELITKLEDNLKVLVLKVSKAENKENEVEKGARFKISVRTMPKESATSIDYMQLVHDNINLRRRVELLNFVENYVGTGMKSLCESVAESLNILCVNGEIGIGQHLNHQVVKSQIEIEATTSKKVDDYDHLYSETFKNYFNKLKNKDGYLGNCATIQTVADSVSVLHFFNLSILQYSVRVVVNSGSHENFLMEWDPQGTSSSQSRPVIFLSYLDGLRYGYLYKNVGIGKLFKRIACNNKLESLSDRLARRSSKAQQVLHEDHAYDQTVIRKLSTYQLDEVDDHSEENSMYDAFAKCLQNSAENHNTVRSAVEKQLSKNPGKYQERVYSEFISKISRSEDPGNPICLQAAADVYNVKVTALQGYDDKIVEEMHPIEQPNKDYNEVLMVWKSGNQLRRLWMKNWRRRLWI